MQLLQEELQGQELLYENFIRAGHSVLDKCDPDTKDTAHISEKMDVISKGWDRIQGRLKERAKNLTAVEGLCADLNDTFDGINSWISDFTDKLESITPGAAGPDQHRAQMALIHVGAIFQFS